MAMPRRILVVDDDPSVRGLVTDVLRLDGYDVTTAEDGYAALRAIEVSRPDCMVLDVMMPGLNGHEVLAEVRANETAHLPVVMLTALAADDSQWQAWSGGVDYFLAKPFEAEELLRWLGYLFSDQVVG